MIESVFAAFTFFAILSGVSVSKMRLLSVPELLLIFADASVKLLTRIASSEISAVGIGNNILSFSFLLFVSVVVDPHPPCHHVARSDPVNDGLIDWLID